MRVRHFSLAFSFASLATISAVWALQHRHWVAERHESRGRSCLFDDTVPVMVARHALAPGRPVSAGDVALVQMPWKFRADPAGQVQAEDFRGVLGQAPSAWVRAGDVLRWDDFPQQTAFAR
jgi:hypothetical protein